ncbi:hypothetical protein [Actinomadura oligospora]|uniref:hypothetical protein n=1 Tax=Actinomadura oligospora TaxID=111804 RepID=UPI0012FA626C|nr:hypothetical protein [Actinomadura oligospora]
MPTYRDDYRRPRPRRSRRRTGMTRLFQDVLDDVKDYMDDNLDRTRDVETSTRDALTRLVEDRSDLPSRGRRRHRDDRDWDDRDRDRDRDYRDDDVDDLADMVSDLHEDLLDLARQVRALAEHASPGAVAAAHTGGDRKEKETASRSAEG